MARRYYPSTGRTPWWMYLDPMRRDEMGIPNVAAWVGIPFLIALAPVWLPHLIRQKLAERRQMREHGHICNFACRHDGDRPTRES